MSGSGRLAVFRADASPQIGGGHIARCMTLANCLRTQGWRCVFVVMPPTLATMPGLAASGLEVVGVDSADAPLPHAIGAIDLLVVDHYGLNADFEQAQRGRAERILVIDDLADRPHDCDVLLDATPGRDASAYDGLTAAATLLLLGPEYALLRPEFALARRDLPYARKSHGRPRLAVGFGATDPGNLTSIALQALAECDRSADATIMLGPAAPHRDSVARLAEQTGARLLTPDADVAAVLSASDLALGAGGSSALERCCLGLPSLIVVAADNQRANAQALAGLGAAMVVERPEPAVLAQALSRLLDDPVGLDAMAAAALKVCDGSGALRVALALDPPTASGGGSVMVRAARSHDEAMLLAWRCDAGTRAFARNPEPPTAAEHRDWLRAKLADPTCLLHVLTLDGEPAGVLRLDWRTELPGVEISLTVAPDLRGSGIGAAALVVADRLAGGAQQWAFVKQGNRASQRIFAQAGFFGTERPGWYIRTDRPAASNVAHDRVEAEEMACRDL